MSVKVRPYKRGGWEIDIRVDLADGTARRERTRSPVSSRAESIRIGERRKRELLLHGVPKQREAPTLNEFWPRFMDGYVRANRLKPSGVAAKESIGGIHLLPRLGSKRLSEITTEDVQRLKSALASRAPKTVNNVLTVLNVALRKAVEWDVIERMPCSVRLLPVPKSNASFHDFDAYERLVSAAERLGSRTYLLVLLGGEAGLRCGEMMALEWGDIDLQKRQITVQRSDWKGHLTPPKSGRVRHVPMTRRLAAALQNHRHLRGKRVLYQDDGSPLTQKIVQDDVARAARRATSERACTSCGIRSRHISRCGEHLHARFRSWLVIRI